MYLLLNNYENLPSYEISNPRRNTSRRNMDSNKRSLERAWQGSRSFTDLQIWLRSMIREGDVSKFPMYRMQRIAEIQDDTEFNNLGSLVWLGIADRQEISNWKKEAWSLDRSEDYKKIKMIIGENRCMTYELGNMSPSYDRLDLDNNMLRRLRIPLNENNYIFELWDTNESGGLSGDMNVVGFHLIRESDGIEIFHDKNILPRRMMIDNNISIYYNLTSAVNRLELDIGDLQNDLYDENYEMSSYERVLDEFYTSDDFDTLQSLLEVLRDNEDQLSQYDIEHIGD